MKKILSVITLLCMIVNIYTVGSYAAIYSAGENIAPQSKVTASTTGGDAGSNAASVIDGMTQNTSGIYKWFVLNGCNGAWLEFDFPQNVTLCGAKVYSGSPVLMEGAKYDILEDFRIDGYVNGEWQPLAEISGNSARETKITFDRPVESGKYRLISTTDARFRITEVELYEGVKSDSYYESGNMIEIAGAKGEFYAKALRMLTNIGLYEYNADFFAYDPCSKGEFIKSVLRLMNVENAEHMSEGSVYSDIAWGDEYAYLRAAETAGIIGIDGKKEFNPEAELTEEEAAQILVCMLGYGAKAEALGGYPSGYVKTAADLKLFKNTQRRKDKLIQKGNAVVLLYNAANTDVYEQTSFGKFGKFEKTGTALEVYHNIYREEGVVTKTEITGIDGNPCGRGKVAVNDTEYRVGDTNAGIYLGYCIKAYVREDSDTDTIVYFEVSDSNTVYTVMGEDVARDSTLTKIRYYNDKNVIRSINVSNKAYYLRNGTCDEITPAVLAPGYGKLIIIDNDNDGRADVVFIHEWIHMVVSDVIDGVIYDKLGDEIIDTQKTDALIIYRNGVECSLDSVSEKDIFTYTDSGRSPYEVTINGTSPRLVAMANADVVQYTCTGAVRVNVKYNGEIGEVAVRPESYGIEYEISDGVISFDAYSEQYISVEVNGDLERPLFIFLNPPAEKPDESEQNVLFLDKQEIYRFKHLSLQDNMTVYLGDDVILDACIDGLYRKNIKIIGNGYIMTNGLVRGKSKDYAVAMYGCENVTIQGPVIYGDAWINSLYGCNNLDISYCKVIGPVIETDGYDIYGCSNVKMNNIFIRNVDDGFCIKTNQNYPNVENVEIINSVCWTSGSGNAMEIGFELSGDGYVRNVKYRNIDVIHRQTKDYKNNRAAMSIHHSGRARVEDILYEDIRVESSDENFIVLGFWYYPAYSLSTEPWKEAEIKNVTYRNVSLTGGDDCPSRLFCRVRSQGTADPVRGSNNALYSTSDEYKLPVENIVFENLVYKGTKITSESVAREYGFDIEDGVDVSFVQERTK